MQRALLDNPSLNVTTSAPTENQLIEYFYQLIKEDVQEVLIICLSSSLSQTYNNLLNISSMFSHRMKIYLYDSRTISHGEAVMVLEASKLLNQGATMPEIITQITALRQKMTIYMTVDNLKTMIRTKRISAPAGFFANLFDIKPIVYLNDSGRIVPFEKVRSFDKCIRRLAEIVVDEVKGKKGQMYLASGQLNPYIKPLTMHLAQRGYADLPVMPIASVSLANIGVFALGVIFIED
nr:DegV family protein [Moraxella osloensis]